MALEIGSFKKGFAALAALFTLTMSMGYVAYLRMGELLIILEPPWTKLPSRAYQAPKFALAALAKHSAIQIPESDASNINF